MKTLFTVCFLTLAVMVQGQNTKKWSGAENRDWDVVSLNWFSIEGLPLPTNFNVGDNAIFDDSRLEAQSEEDMPEAVNVVGALDVGDITISNSENILYRFLNVDGSDSKFVGEGTLIKEGDGELISSVLNELENGTIVRGGILTMDRLNDPNIFGPQIVFENNGTIVIGTHSTETYPDLTSTWIIEEGESGGFKAARYVYVNNVLKGSGTLNFIGRGERSFVRFDQNADWRQFSGRIVVTGENPFKAGYTGMGLQTGITWNVNDFQGMDENLASSSVYLTNQGAIYSQSGERCYRIGSLSGSDDGIVHGFMRSSTTPGIYYLVGGLNKNDLLKSIIRPIATQDVTIGGNKVSMPRRDNRVGIIKEGSGILKLTNGMNYITGGVNIVEGTVYISNPEGTRSGTGHVSNYGTVVWVGEEGTLGGTGIISGHIDVRGRLEPGENKVGTLTIRDFLSEDLPDSDEPRKFDIVLRESAHVEMELNTADYSDRLVSDSIIYNGVLEVKLSYSYNISEGDEFLLFDAERKFNSESEFTEIILPMEDEGWVWDITSLYETGSITLVTGGGQTEGEEPDNPFPEDEGEDEGEDNGEDDGEGEEPPTALSGVVDNELIIYPNPNKGEFTVQIPEAKGILVEVFNAAGAMVTSKPVVSSNVFVSLAGHEKGLYIVRVQTTNAVIVHKVIVR